MQKPQYVPVQVPDLVAELKGKTLFKDTSTQQAVQSPEHKRRAGAGFSFDKALSGIKSEQCVSAVSSRGDGKLDGGAMLLQRC